MKLLTHRVITGRIHLKTGLHIGGGGETIEIGGMDNPIIKNPLDNYPYIPGSSLKGKMRSLLEWKDAKSRDGNPCACAACDICKIFGTSGARKHAQGPTRIIVRDAHLTEKSRERLKDMREEKGLIYAEVKHENSIDRLKGTAKNPRPTERVPAGIDFDFEIVLRVFEGDRADHLLERVREALGLVEMDALGGSGSRGYGKVEFLDCRDEAGSDVGIP